ncbi:MAG TPA: hypothetical protein VN580_13120 [Clostridia bacterium]|nr:hypothetical protein [Clostridia bacterium]
MAKSKSMEGWVFVKNVADDQEAVLVESVLGTENIPVQRKYKEDGNYLEVYMGMSKYGIDLFVPEQALELAKGLLDSETIDMPEEAGAEEVARDGERYETKRRNIVWIILAYLFLPVLAALLWRFFW